MDETPPGAGAPAPSRRRTGGLAPRATPVGWASRGSPRMVHAA
jgi:hypothetical protein